MRRHADGELTEVVASLAATITLERRTRQTNGMSLPSQIPLAQLTKLSSFPASLLTYTIPFPQSLTSTAGRIEKRRNLQRPHDRVRQLHERHVAGRHPHRAGGGQVLPDEGGVSEGERGECSSVLCLRLWNARMGRDAGSVRSGCVRGWFHGREWL
jgi:hypothetical protein